MPLNKDAYRRYKIIEACITNKHKPYPSMPELIEACEEKIGHTFTVSTIQKDIQSMKEGEPMGCSAPIKFSKSKNGYYYEDPEFRINSVPLNETDIEALKTVTDMLSNFMGTRVSENFNHAIEKILTAFKESFPDGDSKRKIIQTEEAPVHKGFEHFEFFFRAIKDKTPVCFVHYSYRKRIFNSGVVYPILLKEFQNSWYIVGYSDNHKELRTFGLDRIYDPLPLKGKFKEPNQKIKEEYFKYVYGVYPLPGQKRQQVIFHTKSILTNYLQAHPIHESQKVTVHQYGDSTITLEIIPSQELLNFFMSFSLHLKVTTPEWIQENIRNQHIKALENEKEAAG